MYKYYEKVTDILSEVFTQEKKNIDAAIELLTQASLNKQSIFIFGASHAGILAEEMMYRAGGLMTVNAIFGRELMLDRHPIGFTSQMERLEGYGRALAGNVAFKENDLLILHSVSGRNPVIIDMALAAKEKGVKILALTSVEYSASAPSRHSSGKRLYELADIVIDNHGNIGDGTVQLAGLEQPVGPSSTVVGAMVLNSIVVEVTQNLIDAGLKNPPIFYSANIDGGDALNQQLIQEYADVIHYKL